MNKKNQIIMSAASVSAALSAVATMGDQNQILETPKASPYDAAALEAISTAKSQAIVRGSFGEVAKTIRLDADLRRAIYSEVAQGEADWEQIKADQAADNVAEEPTIEYDQNGIPININEIVENEMSLGDGSLYVGMSAQDMFDQLGITVPEGISADAYMNAISDIYGEIVGGVVETGPIDESLGSALATVHLMDSTNTADVFSCYNNCHSACHGSRGWR